MTRVPEDLSGGEAFDPTHRPEDFPKARLAAFPHQFPGRCEIPETFKVGCLRIFPLRLQFLNQTAGMQRHRRLQFFATDLAALILAEQFGGSGDESEIHSGKVSKDGPASQVFIAPGIRFMTLKRV